MSEKSTQEKAQDLIDAMRGIIQNTQNDDIGSISKPFTQKIDEVQTVNVVKPEFEPKEKKELKAFQTHTFIDELFLDAKDKKISGLPLESNSILTGLPNSGKSLLMEQIALSVSNDGKKVCYVLSEEIFRTGGNRYDLETRMREKAKLLNLDWKKICENLFVIDTVAHAELRDWTNFVSVYRKLVEAEGVELLLIDSMTLLEEIRGQLKYRILELMRYNQLHKITSLIINQRAIDESDSLAMAGGISLSHIVDTVMVLDYKKASSWDGQLKQDTGCKQSEVVNFFRILKCRLCKFDAHYIAYKITNDGLIECQTNLSQLPLQ